MRQCQMVETACEQCGQVFLAKPYRVRAGLERFCRPECSREWRKQNAHRRNKRPKLNLVIATAIRTRYAAGDITQAALSRQYGIHQSTISAIICSTTYRPAEQ